jgi:hypothetical protein
MAVIKEVVRFIKRKGKAPQKSMVAPPGQVSQVGWRSRKQQRDRTLSVSRCFLKPVLTCGRGKA